MSAERERVTFFKAGDRVRLSAYGREVFPQISPPKDRGTVVHTNRGRLVMVKRDGCKCGDYYATTFWERDFVKRRRSPTTAQEQAE